MGRGKPTVATRVGHSGDSLKMKLKRIAHPMSALLLLGVACEGVDLPADPSEAPVERAAKAPPIMGGTMMVTRDGVYAVISDPPRDLIHIVDLVGWREFGTIELEEDALPFRAVEDGQGLVHVTLRGSGEVVTVDPRTASIAKTTAVCPNPRGVAFDHTADALHVACAGGVLSTIPAGGGAATHRFIKPDLRDVYVAGGRVFVTRFRSAEIYEVGDEGSTLMGAPLSLVTGRSSQDPSTAWRTLPRPEGGWLMLHQTSRTDPVPGFDEPTAGEIDPSGGYTGSDPCGNVVSPTLSATKPDGELRSAGVFGTLALAVDAAISPDGRRVAIAAPSQTDLPEEASAISLFDVDLQYLRGGAEVECRIPTPLPVGDDVVAVAYQPDGALLAQARDTPVLYRVVDERLQDELVLVGADVSDTGFDLFHNDAGQGVACASCHPEGGEDGRTWVFEDLGPRRTQALNVGLEGTAPFHWKGDMTDIHMIARQVRQGAMGGAEQTEERQAALRDWLFSLRPPNPPRSQADASVGAGEVLFGSMGCARCHAGPSFTSAASSDLGRGPLQTPALRGVAMRPPYMHDGRAATLEDAVVDMVSTTLEGHEIREDEVASLVAYLESL